MGSRKAVNARNDKGGYNGESDDVMPMDAFDFGVGPYDHVAKPAVAGLQGGAISILSNATNPRLSIALSATGLQGQLVPRLYFRQRQGGHYYQPDHGSAQRWPGCGFGSGGDLERSASCCQRSYGVGDGGGWRYGGGYGGVQSHLQRALHCLDKA